MSEPLSSVAERGRLTIVLRVEALQLDHARRGAAIRGPHLAGIGEVARQPRVRAFELARPEAEVAPLERSPSSGRALPNSSLPRSIHSSPGCPRRSISRTARPVRRGFAAPAPAARRARRRRAPRRQSGGALVIRSSCYGWPAAPAALRALRSRRSAGADRVSSVRLSPLLSVHVTRSCRPPWRPSRAARTPGCATPPGSTGLEHRLAVVLRRDVWMKCSGTISPLGVLALAGLHRVAHQHAHVGDVALERRADSHRFGHGALLSLPSRSRRR